MKSRGTAAIFVVILLRAVVGCEGDPFSPENGREAMPFTVAGSAFAPVDTIVATLANRSTRDAGYNLCLAELERGTAAGWVRVQRHPPGWVCTDVLEILAPGESALLTQPVGEELRVGIYRFRATVEWPLAGRRFEVVTGTFEIEE